MSINRKRKKPEPKVKDLHLWAINVSKNPSQLWIVTRKNNARHAMAKALKFEREENGNPHATIKSLEYRGTLDA